jgi:hypothetical protein
MERSFTMDKKKSITSIKLPRQDEVSVEPGPSQYVNLKDPYPGDSVAEHKKQEDANHYLAEGEIGQQNENL